MLASDPAQALGRNAQVGGDIIIGEHLQKMRFFFY